MSKDKVSYEELHKHVVLYSKEGNKDSAKFILEAFNKFIWLYVHLVCDKNNFKVYKKKHREFVSMFCPRFVSLSLDKWKTNAYVRNFLIDAAQHINYIHRKYPPEDIYAECQVIMLQMAKSYKLYDKPTFHTMVDRLFHKKLFTRLKKLASDPFVRKENLEYDGDIGDNNEQSMSNSLWHGENSWVKDIESCEEKIDYELSSNDNTILKEGAHDDLDLDWINGNKGKDIFKQLERTEREILKLYYYDGLTDKQVGDKIGFCMSTINKRRNKILEKLKADKE